MEEGNIPMDGEKNTGENVIQEAHVVSDSRRKPRRKKGCWIALLIFILLFISLMGGLVTGLIIGGISGKFWPGGLERKWEQIFSMNQDQTEVLKQRVVDEDSAVIDVVEKNSPAVVSIVISKDVANVISPFDNFFGFPGFYGGNSGSDGSGSDQGSGQGTQKQKVGGGSGFIITSDGMIVTNKHVVTDKNADYTVVTSDGKEYPAKFLAADPVNDIAVMKIEGKDFPTLNLGDSDAMKIGQTVIAIGNSLGQFSNTVSKGIVSGLGRSVTAAGGMGESAEKLTNIIQTDAAINPGNSGGPLMNINGEVIGVNVAMAQGAQSIGFAIPSNQIKKVVDQVKETGKISSPYLGVRYVEMDDSIKKEINSPYDYGVLVVRGEKVTDFAVIPGSPADKAGIVENDIILEINGTKIDKKNTLIDLVAKNSVGDTVNLKVWHKGDVKDIQARLTERN
jgi:S1-C subfamily serine protease